MHSRIFITKPQKDYVLIDSGDCMKLERYGTVTIARPDPQALWKKSLPDSEWKKADAYFAKEGGEEERGRWVITRPSMPEAWSIAYGGLKLEVKLTPFKHTGLFPEQLNNWQWCKEIIEEAIGSGDYARPTVLNLFGYTGGASLSAALAGAEVTHVDASRAAITWANKNAELSNLADKPIKWMLEDAVSFVKREIRRGKKYNGIIMDPPSFGRGAKGEIWRIEEDFIPLFDDCLKLLSDSPLFIVINGYAAGYSPIAYENNLRQMIGQFGGTIESGELAIEDQSGRLLPCGIVSRWKRS